MVADPNRSSWWAQMYDMCVHDPDSDFVLFVRGGDFLPTQPLDSTNPLPPPQSYVPTRWETGQIKDSPAYVLKADFAGTPVLLLCCLVGVRCGKSTPTCVHLQPQNRRIMCHDMLYA